MIEEAKARLLAKLTAEAAWPKRPFANRRAMHQALCGIVRGAPTERQLALIQAHPDLAGRNVYGLIWTTTPWTIPANMAIAFHPKY